jgi:photosystem II stability/assembly factor-like uncharacterized protein
MSILHLSLILGFQILFGCKETTELIPNETQIVSQHKTPTTNIIIESKDGGQSWQDISQGLPENSKGENLYSVQQELYLFTDHGLFTGRSEATSPIWKQESLTLKNKNLAPTRNGLVAYDHEGNFMQRKNVTSLWSPVFASFKEWNVRTVFETTKEHLLIGCDNGLFKSKDGGQTWSLVHDDGWVIKIVESEGVLIATNQSGIIKSLDGGDHWELVISEHGVGIDAEIINGGFAVITYNEDSKSRRIRTSSDLGKTWQRIDAGLPPHANIASIVEVGDRLFCGHPAGLFGSDDKGKTWKLLVPPIGDKVFNLSVCNNKIYAIPRNGGC